MALEFNLTATNRNAAANPAVKVRRALLVPSHVVEQFALSDHGVASRVEQVGATKSVGPWCRMMAPLPERSDPR
jgi:hypothetical protein